MTNPLLLIFSPETWMCLLVLAGIFMVIGLREIAIRIVGCVILMALLYPFIQSLLCVIPMWSIFILMFFFIISIFRFLFGSRVADFVIGRIMYDLIVLPFHMIGWFLSPTRRR